MEGSGSQTHAFALVIGSMVSLQVGTAIAISAFDEAGPLGVVWVRGVVGATLLTAYLRPKLRAYTPEQWSAIVPYGVSLASFTVFFYLALDRAPLGVVSALEMTGPLAVAAIGRRSRLDLLWIAFAGSGVALLALARGVDGHLDALGVVFALLAATGLAFYIVFGKRVAQRVDGLGGLATALLIAILVQTPFGIAGGGSDVLDARVLGVCVAAGVLSTVIPFSFELIALRTLSLAVFGLVLAFEPVVAAIVGLLFRGQDLAALQIAGIGLIVAAGAGVMGPSRLRGRADVLDDPQLAALARVGLFQDFSPDELATVAGRTRELAAEVGTELIHQGQAGTDLFLVANGEVAVRVDGHVVDKLHPGDFFGELALLSGEPRNATVVATEQSSLYVLTKDDLEALTADEPRIEGKLLAVAAQRLRAR